MLTKEQILKSKDLPIKLVEVPEWGGNVYVRTMTGTDRDLFEQSLALSPDKMNLANIRARLCALTICNEGGERLFEESDIELLGKKSASALDKIFDIAQKINGIGKEDIEDLEKNSGSIPRVSSI